MSDILLVKPEAGAVLNVASPEQGHFIFDFSTGDAVLSRVDDNLVFSFEDGSSVSLTDFYTAYSSENMPSFEIEGVEISGEDFFLAMNEPDLMPAAGPAAGPQESNGMHDWDSMGLYGGLDRLGGLDIGWGDGGDEPELDGGGGDGDTNYPVDITPADPIVPGTPIIDPSDPDSPIYPGDPDYPGLVVDNLTVHESALGDGNPGTGAEYATVSGKMLVTAPDGVRSITITDPLGNEYLVYDDPTSEADTFGGSILVDKIWVHGENSEGYLHNFAFDPLTGELTYDFTLADATQEHQGDNKEDSIGHIFKVTVTDKDADLSLEDSDSADILVTIVDDMPVLREVTAQGDGYVNDKGEISETDGDGLEAAVREGTASVSVKLDFDFGADSSEASWAGVRISVNGGEAVELTAAAADGGYTFSSASGLSISGSDANGYTLTYVRPEGDLTDKDNETYQFDISFIDSDGDTVKGMDSVTAYAVPDFVPGEPDPTPDTPAPDPEDPADPEAPALVLDRLTTDDSYLAAGQDKKPANDNIANSATDDGSFTITLNGLVSKLAIGNKTFAIDAEGNSALASGQQITGDYGYITIGRITGGKVEFTYTQTRNYEHKPDSNAFDASAPAEQFGVTVTDALGQSASGVINVNIEDDGPSITAKAEGELETSDATLGTNAELVLSTLFNDPKFGADGASSTASVVYTFTENQTLPQGIIALVEGKPQAVDVTIVNGVVVGKLGDGTEAFTVTIGTDGNLVFDQKLALQHQKFDAEGDPVATDTSIDLGSVSITATVTDADGDTASAVTTVDLTVTDDKPSITAKAAGELKTSDATLGTNAELVLRTLFNDPKFGADGASSTDSVVYTFTENQTLPQGIIALVEGKPQAVDVTIVNGVVVGKLGDGTEAFTVTIGTDGNLVFDQKLALKHGEGSDNLDLGSVSITATVTDADGDTASDVTSVALKVTDSKPEVTASDPTIVDAFTTYVDIDGSVTVDYGTDGMDPSAPLVVTVTKPSSTEGGTVYTLHFVDAEGTPTNTDTVKTELGILTVERSEGKDGKWTYKYSFDYDKNDPDYNGIDPIDGGDYEITFSAKDGDADIDSASSTVHVVDGSNVVVLPGYDPTDPITPGTQDSSGHTVPGSTTVPVETENLFLSGDLGIGAVQGSIKPLDANICFILDVSGSMNDNVQYLTDYPKSGSGPNGNSSGGYNEKIGFFSKWSSSDSPNYYYKDRLDVARDSIMNFVKEKIVDLDQPGRIDFAVVPFSSGSKTNIDMAVESSYNASGNLTKTYWIGSTRYTTDSGFISALTTKLKGIDHSGATNYTQAFNFAETWFASQEASKSEVTENVAFFLTDGRVTSGGNSADGESGDYTSISDITKAYDAFYGVTGNPGLVSVGGTTNPIKVHAIGFGGGMQGKDFMNLATFDNTPGGEVEGGTNYTSDGHIYHSNDKSPTASNPYVEVSGDAYTRPAGQGTAVNVTTAGALDAAFSAGYTASVIGAVSQDNLDISKITQLRNAVFGDVMNTDHVYEDISNFNGEKMPVGSGFQVFNSLGWSEDEIANYIINNAVDLARETVLVSDKTTGLYETYTRDVFGNMYDAENKPVPDSYFTSLPETKTIITRGGNGGDTLKGSIRDDLLFGQEGNDTITAGGGDDFIAGGTGADTMDGGTGNDIIVYDASDLLVSGGDGIDFLISGTEIPELGTLKSPGEGHPKVEDVEVAIYGPDVLGLTSIDKLAEKGITIDNDGKSLTLAGWAQSEGNSNIFTQGDLIVQIDTSVLTLAPDSDADAIIFTLNTGNGA